jgi:hypothetical protein
MNATAAQHNEVMLSLAEEIRQAIGWLSMHDQPPPAEEIRLRIRMLREAAAVAGLQSVESLLDNLEEEMPARIDEVLVRLSGLISSMAASAEKRELEWVELVQGIEKELERVAERLHRCTSQLSDKTLLIDTCANTKSNQERARLLTELIQEIKQIAVQQRRLRQSILEATSGLRDVSRKLVKELSGAALVPLAPALFGLREQIGGLGKSQGKPVSLHLRCTGIDVGIRQIEPIVRTLDLLSREILQEGMEAPQERRQAKKATVGSLWVSGSRGKGILEIRLEDDGRNERAQTRITRKLAEDLRLLRARLLKETLQEPEHQAGQTLVLQIPSWYNTVEVLPVRASSLEALVPLNVVAEVFSGSDCSDADLPVVYLERRGKEASDQSDRSGLILEVQGWQGKLYADIIGGHFRAIPLPPAPEDPPWIIARVDDGTSSRPVVHPLPLMDVKEHQSCLFPSIQ